MIEQIMEFRDELIADLNDRIKEDGANPLVISEVVTRKFDELFKRG